MFLTHTVVNVAKHDAAQRISCLCSRWCVVNCLWFFSDNWAIVMQQMVVFDATEMSTLQPRTSPAYTSQSTTL